MRKKYVFGYGSLVSADDIARTLGYKPKLIYPFELRGWVREWGVVIDNASDMERCIRLAGGQLAPGYIAVLNVRPAAPDETPTNPNGVLFEVTDEDLRKLDEREICYRRLDVSHDVINAPPGTIYTYSGLDKFLIVNHTGTPTAIPYAYSELVAHGFTALGAEMHRKYLSSTCPSELPIFRGTDTP